MGLPRNGRHKRAEPLEAGVAPANHTRGLEGAHPTKAGPPRGMMMMMMMTSQERQAL